MRRFRGCQQRPMDWTRRTFCINTTKVLIWPIATCQTLWPQRETNRSCCCSCKFRKAANRVGCDDYNKNNLTGSTDNTRKGRNRTSGPPSIYEGRHIHTHRATRTAHTRRECKRNTRPASGQIKPQGGAPHQTAPPASGTARCGGLAHHAHKCYLYQE